MYSFSTGAVTNYHKCCALKQRPSVCSQFCSHKSGYRMASKVLCLDSRRCWQDCVSFWKLWEWVCCHAHSGGWLNSVPCGCWTEISLVAASGGAGLLLLKAACPFSISCFPCAPSLMLWIALIFPFCSITPTSSQRKFSAFKLRLIWLDWIYLDNPGYSPSFKVPWLITFVPVSKSFL